MKIGDTFFNLHPSSPRYLWIVTAGPTTEDELLIFNFTSATDGCDESCVVLPGEHPHVHHRTIVAYGRGSLARRSILTSPRSLCSVQQSVSAGLLRRIQQGALDSQFTKQRFQAIVRQFLLPPT